MKITITSYDTTISAEIPDGSDIVQALNAIRVLLIGAGYSESLIKEFLSMEGEECDLEDRHEHDDCEEEDG